ncbi:MAG: pantetheine-phosphate adenylyltransferase [Erysipelotrichaceae bacterium]
MKAMFPGSFDPITKGHLDIIERASKIFDEVLVVLMQNPMKEYSFKADLRKELVERSIEHLSNVKVLIGTGLTVEFAQKHDIKVLIRGIREVMDYEYEIQQATINMLLNENIETFFMISKPEFSFLSSSACKVVARNHGDIARFVPKAVIKIIEDKYKK